MKLKIIHTNDLHSHFDSFARAASIIKQNKDEHSLILDGGDFADFRSIELQGTRGIAAIELMEEVGYEALTIGNNETFNGVDTLEYMASNSSFPFISNNLLRKDKTHIKGVVPSTLINKNGLRILITGSSPDLEEFNDGLGVHILSYKEAISEEIRKYYGHYDVCILLSHLGTVVDEELANEFDEVDIIISSHDHKLFANAKSVNGTILNSAGCYGEYVGIVEVEYLNDTLTLLDSRTIQTENAGIDQEIVSLLRKNKEIAVEVLSRPLYELSSPLWHDVIEENPISNLIADGLKDMLDCDIGLINSGIVNAGLFNYVSNRKLIEICPSPLNPTSFEIVGKELKNALEQSLDTQNCLADGKGPGFRGKFVGSLHIAGAEVTYEGNHIVDFTIGDKVVVDDEWYKVATSDYLQRGSGYPALANNRNVRYLPEEIKDVIRIYAESDSSIRKAAYHRWKSIDVNDKIKI
ncbi:bifunctional metallophosphatase/5'-nucleotidase [Pseudalkalibacillus berkeleyi]|uniref:5'-nucleotidase C-terminal domain-containing protein n=1 Tax=Pseudalkalibacillus berkeleyi TaxID=1069813 RepID=A0ABS9GZV6_9BACL|nr:5'-nucleotidase C-terminal domain-containing protein [Pseudalkalibacillus berkeleyi]MCF6138274.1 5'-nucleotidase C-terminal domain-containing protein [Pseudalkalibacillus berkeleyi]